MQQNEQRKNTEKSSEHTLGRRDFLKGMTVSAAALVGASALGACASETSGQSAGNTFAQTISWDGEYDVVVVGFGGAGACAARAAAADGAEVLLIEKAPEGFEGGNTQFCGQLFVNGNGNVEGTKDYYRALAGHRSLDESVLDVFAESVANIEDIISETLGIEKSEIRSARTTPEAEYVQLLQSVSLAVNNMCPEYPEYDKAETISICALHDGISDGYLWQTMRQRVLELSDRIDIWLASPGKRLIQDPETKTIIGVQLERKGVLLNIRARNGVVMTCGGFENNLEMTRDYLGAEQLAPLGTPYNTGDGIKMVSEVGADLWHMNVWEGGTQIFGSVTKAYTEDVEVRGADVSFIPFAFMASSAILVGRSGLRYLDEMELGRHGHYYDRATGEWHSLHHAAPCYVVFDKTDAGIIKVDEMDQSIVLSTDSIEGLAAAMEVSAENLTHTITSYNSYAAAGNDIEFGRRANSMRPFGDGPYYALKLTAPFLNTQGGPRKNEKAEILNSEGNPIPHLYSAGEFGGITCNQYQGGGNMAENIIFGQIAGKSAAAAKEDILNPYGSSVDSNIVYVLGKETDL
ncbi:MAG: FAD-binding protein [Coriobacteriales bacterium]|jgi:succinate dehydrogenase/fumarate reductase flavoprotein subunit|nr:FAD-binding protein [Coriobacteriales bacterium]